MRQVRGAHQGAFQVLFQGRSEVLDSNPTDSTLIFVAMKRTAAWLEDRKESWALKAKWIFNEFNQFQWFSMCFFSFFHKTNNEEALNSLNRLLKGVRSLCFERIGSWRWATTPSPSTVTWSRRSARARCPPSRGLEMMSVAKMRRHTPIISNYIYNYR